MRRRTAIEVSSGMDPQENAALSFSWTSKRTIFLSSSWTFCSHFNGICLRWLWMFRTNLIEDIYFPNLFLISLSPATAKPPPSQHLNTSVIMINSGCFFWKVGDCSKGNCIISRPSSIKACNPVLYGTQLIQRELLDSVMRGYFAVPCSQRSCMERLAGCSILMLSEYWSH